MRDNQGKPENPNKKRVASIISRLQMIFKVNGDNALSRAMNLKEDRVNVWRSHSYIPYKDLEKISQIKSLSLEWVLNGRGPVYRSDLVSLKDNKIGDLDVGYTRIPVLEIQAQLGLFENENYNFVLFRRDWLSKHARDIDALRMCMVTDNAMAPRWRLGDVMMIDTSAKSVVFDGFYVVQIQGQKAPTLRWVRTSLSDGSVKFIAFNAEFYEVEERKKLPELTVHGRLVCDIMRMDTSQAAMEGTMVQASGTHS